MMTMIANDDVFLNINNNPNPIAAFNSIMRQHYDGEGNPIQRPQRQTNENREIVSSVQSTDARTITDIREMKEDIPSKGYISELNTLGDTETKITVSPRSNLDGNGNSKRSENEGSFTTRYE